VEFIDSLCCLAGRQAASDIFLHAEQPPQFRINGELATIGSAPVSSEELQSLWTQCGAALDTLDYDGSYIASDGIRALLRDRRFQQVISMIEIGSKDGMNTFDESISNLYAAGIISRDEALLNARDPARIMSIKPPPLPQA
jgi:Tfp pilus assembly pilus retraction ATPase PilT